MNLAITGYLYLVFLVIAWLVDHLPFLPLIKNVSALSMGSLQTIKSNDIDDPDKEKLLLASSLKIFKSSLKLLGFIALIAACGFALMAIGGVFKILSYAVLLKYMATLYGLLLSVFSFISYFLLKKLYVKVRL
ncbi:MAG: hypothetical protein JWP94_1479 [Mucilaginibacter sp.]|jgi:hypothetical protein|nr:hypothetical protein [Mucilaginibacter sp.]